MKRRDRRKRLRKRADRIAQRQSQAKAGGETSCEPIEGEQGAQPCLQSQGGCDDMFADVFGDTCDPESWLREPADDAEFPCTPDSEGES